MLKKRRSQNKLLFLSVVVETGVHQSTEKIDNLNHQNSEKPIEITIV